MFYFLYNTALNVISRIFFSREEAISESRVEMRKNNDLVLFRQNENDIEEVNFD